MRRLLLPLVVLLLGCNTLPVGSDQLRGVPAVDSLNLEPDTTAGYAKYVPLASADTLFLGKDDQYESRVLMKFWTEDRPDSALEDVTSAQIVIHPGDSTPMSFVCRPCSVNWFADAVTWKLAESTVHWLVPGGDFYDIELASGTFEGESLVIDLDLDHLDTFIEESDGIILFPQDTGFCPLFSGFSQETAPRLRLIWGDDEDEQLFSVYEDAHIVDTNDVNPGFRYMIAGSGVAFRSFLYFDTDSIPPEATIARAELSFLPDVEYARTDTVGISVRRLTQSFEQKGRFAEYLDLASARLDYAVAADSDSVAVLDLRALVQFWTANPDSNLGCYILSEPEWSRMFRMRIPTSGPNAPKLDIYYVMPPEGRFW